MSQEELSYLYERQVEELHASQPDWDELELLEKAIAELQ